MMTAFQATDLDSIIHVIQASLTPIFLLTAVSGLLTVFTNWLARISDQVDKFAAVVAGYGTREEDRTARRRLAHLRFRSHLLDLAVILGATAGCLTCLTVLTLFLGALRAEAAAAILFVLFGLAVCLTIGALAAFLVEMLVAGRGLRREAALHAERLE